MNLSNNEPVIGVHIGSVIFPITDQEYEQLHKEVMARCIADEPGISDLILFQVIKSYEYRYNEIKQIKLDRMLQVLDK